MTDFVVRLFESLGPFGRAFPYQKPSFQQFVKFVMVGITSSVINLALLYSFTEFLAVFYLYSAALSLLISSVNGYTLNHKWTFKTEEKRRHHSSYGKYLILITCTYFINLSVLGFLVESFGIWYIFAEIIAIFVALIGNFFGSKFWAFK